MNFLYVQHCMCGVANQMPTMFTVHVQRNKRGATKIDLLFALNMKHKTQTSDQKFSCVASRASVIRLTCVSSDANDDLMKNEKRKQMTKQFSLLGKIGGVKIQLKL